MQSSDLLKEIPASSYDISLLTIDVPLSAQAFLTIQIMELHKNIIWQKGRTILKCVFYEIMLYS